MINFIKRLFIRKPYTFLGKGGISFYDGQEKFYIDTNNFLGERGDVEIFYKDIKLLNSERILSESQKKEIAFKVKNY